MYTQPSKIGTAYLTIEWNDFGLCCVWGGVTGNALVTSSSGCLFNPASLSEQESGIVALTMHVRKQKELVLHAVKWLKHQCAFLSVCTCSSIYVHVYIYVVYL